MRHRLELIIILALAGGVVWARRRDGFSDPPKPYFDYYGGFR